MPSAAESISNIGESRRATHPRGMVSLIITVLLCLPSIIGGIALFINSLQYQELAQWGQISAACVALGVYIGAPSAAVATFVGAVTALRSSVSVTIKLAHLLVVSVAAIAAVSLSLRFRI